MKKVNRKILPPLLAAVMALGMFPFAPVPAIAAGENGPAGLPSIVIGTGQEDRPTVIGFGKKQWVVIGYDGTGVSSVEDTLTLLLASTSSLGNSEFNRINSNYSRSTLQTALSIAVNDVHQYERPLIAPTYLVGGAQEHAGDGMAGPDVPEAKYWPLSVSEARQVNETVRKIPGGAVYWWLRSPGTNMIPSNTVANVYFNGYVDSSGGGGGMNLVVRPAFRLNLPSIIFTSDASSAGVPDKAPLAAYTAPAGAVKFTGVYSSFSSGFGITEANASADPGSAVTLHYTGAYVDATHFIRVKLVNNADTSAIAYAAVPVSGITAVSGTFMLGLPRNMPEGNYTGYAWVEEGKAADVSNIASTPDTFALKVGEPSDKVLEIVTQPEAITDIENGTAKTAEALGLPEKVSLVTNQGKVDADVTWDVEGCTYDRNNKEAQTFDVDGSVMLPAGVSNPNSVPLTISVSVTVDAAPVTVTAVTVSPDTAEVQKGTVQQFTAAVTGTNNPPQTVTWTVEDGVSGTTITSAGRLTVDAGETATTLTVRATSTVDNTKSGTATVTVTDTPPDPRYSISLDQSGTYTFPAATAGYGDQPAKSVSVTNLGNRETGDLVVALSGTGASNFALSTHTVSSITVGETDSFTVKPNTELAAGTYTATVTVSGGNGITASFDVSFTVTPPAATYAVIVESEGNGATGSGNYEKGKTVNISAGTAPDGKRFKRWTTASSGVTFGDPNRANTSFKMPANAVTVTAVFEYIPATVTGVTVNPSTVTVEAGTSYQFSATVNGTGTPSQSVIWSVTDNTHAGTSIAADGTLTVDGDEPDGTVLTVAATSSLDNTKSGTATVTVSTVAQPDPEVLSVSVNPDSITLNKGDTYTFSAHVTGTNNPPQGVTWTVEGGISGTTITPGGRLTVDADETAATLTVKAASTLAGYTDIYGTATVTVIDPPEPEVYAITFDANGGTVSPAAMRTGTDGKLPSLPTPQRSGNYSFTGWYTAASGGLAVTTNTVFVADTTIYAHWKGTGGSGGGGGSSTPSNAITAPTTDAGWSNAADTVNILKDGETFTINIGSQTNVPGDFFAGIAGKDVNITFNMGGGMSWTVNGQDIPKGTDFGALNLGVSTGTNLIPATMVGLDGSVKEVQLQLAADGEFPFQLTLSLNLDKANAGLFANLFYHNPATDQLEFVRTVTIGADGKASFPFDHASGYLIAVSKESMAPAVWANPFADVKSSDWFYGDVEYAVTKGLFNGTSETAFSPNVPMTRAMLVTVLYRAGGSPEVEPMYAAHMMDVAQGSWYEDAMGWAAQNNIISGYGEGLYGPQDPITREQMAAILYSYANWKGEGPTGAWAVKLSYADTDKIANWAMEGAMFSQINSIITGKPGGLFDPQGLATRAEVAAVLHRFLEK